MGNHYKNVSIAVVFVLASVFSLFAQSDNSISNARSSESVRLTADAGGSGAAAGLNVASNVPDAPSATREKEDASAGAEGSASPIRKNSQGAPPAAVGPNWSEVRRTADRQYWEVTGSMFAVSIANAELAQRCLHQLSCTWVPTEFRSRAAMYGAGIPADLGISYLTYRLKRGRKSLWFLPSTLVTAANAYVAVHDYRRLH